MVALLLHLVLASETTLGQKGDLIAKLEYSRTDGVNYLEFDDNGTRLVVGTLTGELSTWDLRIKRRLSHIIMGREIRRYAFAGPQYLFTLHADGSVAVRDSTSGEVVKRAFAGRKATWIGGTGKAVLAVT